MSRLGRSLLFNFSLSLLSLLFWLDTARSQASHLTFINQFLNDVKQNSRTIESIQSASKAQVLSQDLELSQFDLTNTLSASMTDDQSPASNPFAPNQLQTYSLSANFKKLFESGVETSLNLAFIDNRINFPTNPEIN